MEGFSLIPDFHLKLRLTLFLSAKFGPLMITLNNYLRVMKSWNEKCTSTKRCLRSKRFTIKRCPDWVVLLFNEGYRQVEKYITRQYWAILNLLEDNCF